jgi:GntR family transcriptional regulator
MTSTRFLRQPLYLQLRDALTERIAGGYWKSGQQIPNEGDLAREFGVSAGTVRKSLKLMEEQGLLVRRQGRGSFVNDQSSDAVAARYCCIRTNDGEPVAGNVRAEDIREATANEMERARLGLKPMDRIYRIRRVLSDQGCPLMVEQVALPAALFPDLLKSESTVNNTAALAQDHGVLLGRAEEMVSIGEADPMLAKSLNVKIGTPVLVLDRVTRDLLARPIEWRLGHCHLNGSYSYVSQVT